MGKWIKLAAEHVDVLLQKQVSRKDRIQLFQNEGFDGLKTELSALGWNCEGTEDAVCAVVCMPADASVLAKLKADRCVLVAYNRGHVDAILAELVGDSFSMPNGAAACKQLEKEMMTAGYEASESNDVRGKLNEVEEVFDIYGDTLLRQMMESVKIRIDNTADSVLLVRSYIRKEEIAAKECAEKAPFLTVITRTQGSRIHELREVALCLSAQSNRDFEWIIIGHKVETAREEAVKELISELPDYLGARTRYLSVDWGTRATPLNVGFEQARGSYAVVLDDDDIVMDDWVDQFYQAAVKAPGRMLHAYCVAQKWERHQKGTVLRAIGAPDPMYCKPFDWCSQFQINSCPLHSMAFPLYAHRELNIRFDETLNVTEDWDCIMRTASLTGVIDIPVVTAIYRLWSTDTSHHVHKENEWEKTYNELVGKFGSVPLMLPAECGFVPKNFKDALRKIALQEQFKAQQQEEEKNAELESVDYREMAEKIHCSKGYKITAPLRWIASLIRFIFCGILNLLGAAVWKINVWIDRLSNRIAPKTIDIDKADEQQLFQYVVRYHRSLAFRFVWLINKITGRKA